MKIESRHPAVAKKIADLEHLVGNTPLVSIEFSYKGSRRFIHAKMESYNLTGSIKDRMALQVLRSAYQRGEINPGDRIAEATSGNTGIAFSAIGRALGHPVTIFMPDWMSRERKAIIEGFGAKIVPVSREQGGFIGSIRLSEELARSENAVFLPRQFSNPDNVNAHVLGTGSEICRQLASIGLKAGAFVAGVGTGGTVMGVGQALRRLDPSVKIYPLEPTESPTMSTGSKVGHHRLQGISDEFIPPIVKLNELDPVVDVCDGDSILMAQKLASRLGLGVGISSGANFLGALKVQNQLGASTVVTTIFSDDNKKYLSTDLFREEPVKSGFLSPDVELLDFTVVD